MNAISVGTGAAIGGAAGLGIGLVRGILAWRKLNAAMAADTDKVDAASIRDLPVLRSRDEMSAHFGGNVPFGMRSLINPNSPNAFYLDRKRTGGRPAYVLNSDKVPARLARHEQGHAAQDREGKLDLGVVKSIAIGNTLGMKHTPRYKLEVDAWDRAGVPASDDMRTAALATYEALGANSLMFQGALVGALAAWGYGAYKNRY
jgi:hypothetical protein